MNRSAGFLALKFALWVLLLLIVLLLVVLPLVTSFYVEHAVEVPRDFTKYLRFIESLQAKLMQFMTAGWFLFLGSCFASFLNVVAWRVPRGRSILGSSQCPHCDTELTFRDNIPILGWLKNGGACRTCKTPITSRYFVVEVLLGCVFLAVVLLTLVTGGVSLPLRTPDVGTGFERILFDPKWDLIQLVVHQLTLLSILFTYALVRLEGKPIPVSIFAVATVFAITYSFVFPFVQLVHWQNPSSEPAGFSTFEVNQVLYLLFGGIVGFVVGLLIDSSRREERSCSIICMATVGLFLGWQSAISVGLIVIAANLFSKLSRITDFHRLNRAGQIFAATIVHLFFWKAFSQANGFWPDHQSGIGQTAIALIVLAVGGLLMGSSNANEADAPSSTEKTSPSQT